MGETVAIILNWRDVTSTIECVDSLFALDGTLNFIVVDNDSADGSIEIIAEHVSEQASRHGYHILENIAELDSVDLGTPWVFVVSSGRNGGYAYGNNFGIKLALQYRHCNYLWILNADVLVPSVHTLTRLTAYMNSNPDIGICGATVCYAGDPGCVQTLGGGDIDMRGRTTQFGQGQALVVAVDSLAVERKLRYVNGACSFVRRFFIEQVGLMSEDYFLYFEELDWAARGRERFRLGYCPDAIVLHHVGKSIGTRDSQDRSALSSYYMNASQLRYCTRFLLRAVPWVMFSMALEVGRCLRRRQWRNAAAIVCALMCTGPEIPKKLGVFG